MLVSPTPSFVAFTAKLNGHAENLGLHQAIIFDVVQTNVGGAYSTDNGMFTAPAEGVYYFSATIMCHSGTFLEAEIVHNGNHVVYMYASDSNYEQGTNSAVLEVQEGDHVWVRNARTESDKVYGNDWTTFTGFRLSY